MTFALKGALLLAMAPLAVATLGTSPSGTLRPGSGSCVLHVSIRDFDVAADQATSDVNVACSIRAAKSDAVVALPFPLKSSSRVFQEPGASEVQFFYGPIEGHTGFGAVVFPGTSITYRANISVTHVLMSLNPTTEVGSNQAIYLPFAEAFNLARQVAPDMEVLRYNEVVVDGASVNTVSPTALLSVDRQFIIVSPAARLYPLDMTIYLQGGGLTLLVLVLLAIVSASTGFTAAAVPVPRRLLALGVVVTIAVLATCVTLWMAFLHGGMLRDLAYLLPLSAASGLFVTYLMRLLSAGMERRRTRLSTRGRESVAGSGAPGAQAISRPGGGKSEGAGPEETRVRTRQAAEQMHDAEARHIGGDASVQSKDWQVIRRRLRTLRKR